MPKAGNVVIDMRLGSSSRMAFMLRRARLSSVVQLWPAGVTYCRSSLQIGQAGGGLSLGAYWVPQVVQMKAGMITKYLFSRTHKHSRKPNLAEVLLPNL